MRVGAVQHDIAWENPEANFAALAPRIDEAAARGAQFIALTEMYSNGFSMNTAAIAEPIDGPSTAFLIEAARRSGAWVCGSIPELAVDADKPYNCLVLAGPDGSVHRYAKKHRFAFAGEDEHYSAGSENVTVTIAGVRLSLFVCFDLRFAPDFWDAADDTDLYVVVANWPAVRSAHWTTLLQARAIENQAYVLGVNRVGHGDGIDYTGDSRIFDPLGETIAEAPAGEEVLLMGDVDADVVARVRSRFPFRGI